MKLKFILLLSAILAKANAPGQASTLPPRAHPTANSWRLPDAVIKVQNSADAWKDLNAGRLEGCLDALEALVRVFLDDVLFLLCGGPAFI